MDKKDEDGYRKGDSQYFITNKDIIDWLKEEGKVKNRVVVENNKIYIPCNLSIYATMNTSDQNVFVLDTAFKRRWNMKYVDINFDNNLQYNFDLLIIPSKGKDILWKDFVTAINDKIPSLNNGLNGDDKLIGPYFVSKDSLLLKGDSKENIDDKIDSFAQKVFMYLWNDVVKTDKSGLFRKDIKSYNTLINEYKKVGIEVFEENVKNAMKKDF